MSVSEMLVAPESGGAHRRPPRPLTRIQRVLQTVGELFVTSGVVILLFVAYLLWWTDIQQHHTQQVLRRTLEQSWIAPGPVVTQTQLGSGIAVLRIPRLGASYDEVIVEGVATADLQKGPGHVPGTALPGEVGNFVVSGHRTTYGHPFYNLDQVRSGDLVVVETRTQWLTFGSVGEQTVLPTAVEVTDPVPPRFSKPGAYLTFTTCTPRYSATHRLIMFGELLRSEPKTPGFVPASLRPGILTEADLAKVT